MSAVEGHFEAKKHAYRQTQDGVVISFVIHPQEVDAKLAAAALGTRYMIGWAEIGDNEREKPKPDATPAGAVVAARSGATAGETAKPKRKFTELSLPEQCALRCEDGRFVRYLGDIWLPALEENGKDVVRTVRAILRVASRSELSTNHEAANRWRMIETGYQRWLTDETYRDQVR